MGGPWNRDKSLVGKLRPCACGKCNEMVMAVNKRGYLVRFKKGHFGTRNGDKCNHWKGGRIIDYQGYVRIKDWSYPNRATVGYVKEHKLVWEKHHKACMLSWGVVHHKNENRQDNRIENLQGMTRGQHQSYHNKKGHTILSAP